MLFYKQLNPQGQQKLLQSLSQYAEDILLHDSSKLSYQLAYDQVYQLCRNEKQQKLLQTVYSSIRRVLPKAFNEINSQSINFLSQVSLLIQKTQKNLQTIKDVCLYLDLNYCKRDKNIELLSKLNQIFLQEFFNKTQLLEILGKTIAEQHLKDNLVNIKQFLQSIKLIDNQDEYFVNNFVRFYMPTIIEHYKKQSNQQFLKSSNNIQNYIKYSYESLQNQSQFLISLLSSKKCAANRAFIIKQLYEVLVTKYKQQIYINHKQKLFNTLTLQILQLFKFDIKKHDIQTHADWYNIQIKQKLQTFSHQNNTNFINHICQFYKEIMTLLQKTYNKFDIHYRSRFAFQQWINQEKLQMPLRLNQYIKQVCLRNIISQQEEKNSLEKIGIVFILMKQKNVFQKYYRREMINRIVDNFNGYNMEREKKIIALMEKQCSEQFIKNIKPITQAYQSSLFSQKVGPKTNIFLLNVQNSPYDQKNTSIAINQNLSLLTQKYTNNFTQNNKDKTLYWHPIIGVVRLNIRFLKSNWFGQIIVNTCMANILLYFIKTKGQSFQLKNFCCQTGYKLDQLYDSLRKLIHVKILINEGNEQNYKLGLNQQFIHQSNSFNVLNVQVINKFESKPLEELKADRKFMVQAIIVKLIKKFKRTDPNTLLKEAAPLIQKRGFNFNVKFVQSAIQRLIDKEFIRDFQDGYIGYIA